MAKTKAQLQAELEELKGRLRELTAQQASRAEAPATPADEDAGVAPGATDGGVDEDTNDDGVDFDELVDLLKQEVEDLPTMTCLAIFGLGLVTGRLLAH